MRSPGSPGERRRDDEVEPGRSFRRSAGQSEEVITLDSNPLPTDLTILSETAEAQRIQQIILDHLLANGFSDRELFGIKLALEEALVNAMKHGNRMDRTKKVWVSYRVHNDEFVIRIRDEGKGFNPAEVPDPTVEENLERACGRGLLLMRYYMTEVLFLEEGNVCEMRKRRAAPSINHSPKT
jgi:serine/threonine-protein kinase RsbW